MISASSVQPELTNQLLSLEIQRGTASKDYLDEAIRVCARLRSPFARLAGIGGYSSFLSRSLALGRVRASSLSEIQVHKDATLSRCVVLRQADAPTDVNAGFVFITCLLDLLVTFIGESLTLTLVLEAWPDNTFDLPSVETKEQL